MKKIISIIVIFISLCICLPAWGQNVGINATGNAPHPSAILDVESTSKGMLIPRMTTAQRALIASPATGLLVFDSTTGSFWFKSAKNWVELTDKSDTIWTKTGSVVYVNNGENVGIGTSSPSTRLEIDRGTDIANGTGGYLQMGATSNPNLAIDNNEIQARNNGIASNLYMQLGGGYVGIGTNTPEVKLQVTNGTDVSAISGGYLQLGSSSNLNLAFDNNEIQARNVSEVSPLYLQSNGGNLQIGALTAPSVDVHINNGKLVKSGTGNFNMMPLCYGSINYDGTIYNATPNVSVRKGSHGGEYFIRCDGLSDLTVTMATLTGPLSEGKTIALSYISTPTREVEVMIYDTRLDMEFNNSFSFVFYNP
jgi:hypothetical protein